MAILSNLATDRSAVAMEIDGRLCDFVDVNGQ